MNKKTLLHQLQKISLLIAFFLIIKSSASAQTLTSDLPDYAPMSTATLTGSGFQPGETVVLKVKNLNQPCSTQNSDSTYAPWTAMADSSGSFITTWTVCNCPGDSLRAKATGSASGLFAYAYFTDGTWTLSPNQVVCRNTVTELTFSVTTTGTPNNNAFKINFPSSFTLSNSSIESVTGGKTWTSSISGTSVCLTRTGNASNAAQNGDVIVFKVSVNASTATGSPFSLSGLSNGSNTACPSTGTIQSATASITVNQAPSFTQCPANQSVNTDAGNCTAVVSYSAIATGSPTPAVTYTFSGATTASGNGTGSGSTFNKGVTNVTIKAANSCSPDAICSFTVTVSDQENPAISCASAQTRNTVSNACSYSANATEFNPLSYGDNCSGSSIAYTLSGSTSGNGSDLNGVTFNAGTTNILWTVTDGSGNSSTCSSSVTVEDHTPPVANCRNVTIQLDATGNASLTAAQIDNGSTDACGIVNRTISPSAFTCADLGTNAVTFTVTDGNGNASTCTSTVTVEDAIDPVISTIPNINVNNTTAQCGAVVTFANPTATDNCSASVTQIAGPASGSVFPIGTTTIQFRATDDSGNDAVSSASVTVVDNENPVLTLPSDITISVNAANCKATVAYAAPTISDNCSGGTITQTGGLPTGSEFPLGTTINTFTATDASGNSVSGSFQITVVNAAPVIGVITPSPGDMIAVNNTITLTANITDESNGGPYTVTFIWDDATANTVQTVAGGAASFSAAATHTYTTSGVFIPKVRISDACGATTEKPYQYIVVYLAGKQFTTAGGHFIAPVGSLVSDPSLSGNAVIGDVCKSKSQGIGFDGELEFNFPGANFNFKSSNPANWDYLTITGCYMAIFRGSGTVNGSGNYGILVAQTDRDRIPTMGNRIRIKIWNKNAGNAVVFDTQTGDPDNAVPTTVLRGGNIKVSPASTAGCNSKLAVEEKSGAFTVDAYPNPVHNQLMLALNNTSANAYTIRMYDQMGRIVHNAIVEANQSNTQYELDVTDFAKGLYMLQVFSQEEKQIIRIVVE